MKGNLKKVTIISILLLMTVSLVLLNKNNIYRYLYPLDYSSYVEKYSDKYGVDKYLVYSIIKTESKFNPRAISSKNAKGLMQIGDMTARWAAKELKIKDMDIYDPETNIMIGTWYLSKLDREFKGNLTLVITAYNGGSGNVRKWLKSAEYSRDGKNLDNIPFRETSAYTYSVLDNYRKYKELYDR